MFALRTSKDVAWCFSFAVHCVRVVLSDRAVRDDIVCETDESFAECHKDKQSIEAHQNCFPRMMAFR